MDSLENVGATGYAQDKTQQKKKNQDKVVIKDVATILSTTGIESLATLPVNSLAIMTILP